MRRIWNNKNSSNQQMCGSPTQGKYAELLSIKVRISYSALKALYIDFISLNYHFLLVELLLITAWSVCGLWRNAIQRGQSKTYRVHTLVERLATTGNKSYMILKRFRSYRPTK